MNRGLMGIRKVIIAPGRIIYGFDCRSHLQTGTESWEIAECTAGESVQRQFSRRRRSLPARVAIGTRLAIDDLMAARAFARPIQQRRLQLELLINQIDQSEN